MSLPEISRRCLGCGAAVRAGARFCPQCGQQMDAEPAADAPAVLDDVRAVPDSGPAREPAPPTKEFSAFAESSGGGAAQTSEDGARAALRETRENAGAQTAVESPAAETAFVKTREVEAPAAETAFETAVETPAARTRGVETVVETPAVETRAVGEGAASGEDERGRVARVREGARERVGVARERVGRMKDDALVALEEPPDDSGLSFVLTAAALFVLFLVILLLSTTILR